MKVKIYLRVAKGTRGPRVAASTTPNHNPLKSSSYADEALPTAAFAVVIDIPDAKFTEAERVLAEIALADDQVDVLVTPVESTEC